MKKAPKRITQPFYRYDANGECQHTCPPDVSGNLTGVRGNLSGVYGDLDDCEISPEDRKRGICIANLIEGGN